MAEEVIECVDLPKGDLKPLYISYDDNKPNNIIDLITNNITRLICKEFNTIIIENEKSCSLPDIERCFIGKLIVQVMGSLEIDIKSTKLVISEFKKKRGEQK